MNIQNKTLNIGGKIIEVNRPLIMGIINLTTDSFYVGSRVEEKYLLSRAETMIKDGADILDIGAQSTRPGAKIKGEKYEKEILEPAIHSIKKHFDTPLSVDTFHASVAEVCLDIGVDIINDVSGGLEDPSMITTVAKKKGVYICSHLKGAITEMQLEKNTTYLNIYEEITNFFIQKRNQCYGVGIKDLILDIGFGFSKKMEDNYRLIKFLPQIKNLFSEILMLGVSRKSSIYKLIGATPKEALSGTIALETIALINGVDMIRVHDVKEAKDIISITQYYKNINP